MRTTMKLSISTLAVFALFALATGIAACSDARATETAQADELKRDLELASATTMKLAGPAVNPALLNTMETQPMSAPTPATSVKRGAGTRAVRSNAPTVLAAPESEAADETSVELEALASAPMPDVSEPVAVAPRPTAPEVIATSLPAGDYGTGSGGGGVFGGGGGRGGVVIRGGGVHGDNCELHRRPRGTTSRGPVYVPSVPIASQPTVSRPGLGRGISIGSRSADNRRTTTASVPAAQSPRTRAGPSRRGL